MLESAAMMTAASPRFGGTGDLISSLLDDQSNLTAVERFAQFHEDVEVPLHDRFYRSLLPAEPPGPGQQYAFEVDLDRCSGCKACVTACHALNGLDEAESWRDVGLIVGGRGGLPILQHVTSSCHHCLEPACLTACPVDAYEKDPVTGIVRHLDDQCFGCQYCTLACPYDAPKFHVGKGIVRKCDMCSDRLAVGEAPACVQACPHEAIRIRVVDRDTAAARGAAGIFLPSAPDPSFTLPTTRYLTDRALGADVHAVDGHRDAPEHAHKSLVAMLVLTQASVGAIAADFALRAAGQAGGIATALLLGIGVGAGHLGLVASLFHLGRPQYAYRALIGLLHSWLSREVAAFGVYALIAAFHLALTLLPAGGGDPRSATALAASTTVAGLGAVACSAMVYHATRRPLWHFRWALARFSGTAALLGALTLLVAASFGGAPAIGLVAALAALGAAAANLWIESRLRMPANDPQRTPAARAARLLEGRLAGVSVLRRVMCLAGGVLLPLVWIGLGTSPIPHARPLAAILALALALAGELAERYLFFAAAVRPKMPGGMGA